MNSFFFYEFQVFDRLPKNVYAADGRVFFKNTVQDERERSLMCNFEGA
ncbi:hypothetical protein KUC_0650 [Vreelandella boliviensis LC1]|uniref:Uncharacterized protein n=1 Tax=Vreelandella boliviensis LC1 TaxID=1072583 RepID=A0A7U9C337_9GAMM|nr:hypothetical protein KUC_0650 [Halomonas boliviensis LC1]